jgi:hypothetical protein
LPPETKAPKQPLDQLGRSQRPSARMQARQFGPICQKSGNLRSTGTAWWAREASNKLSASITYRVPLRWSVPLKLNVYFSNYPTDFRSCRMPFLAHKRTSIATAAGNMSPCSVVQHSIRSAFWELRKCTPVLPRAAATRLTLSGHPSGRIRANSQRASASLGLVPVSGHPQREVPSAVDTGEQHECDRAGDGVGCERFFGNQSRRAGDQARIAEQRHC